MSEPTDDPATIALLAILAAWAAEENPGHSDLDNEQPIALTVRLTLGDVRAMGRRYPALATEARAAVPGRCPKAVAAGAQAEAEG